MGFTNKLACAIIVLVSLDLIGGFFLAYLSIKAQYTGALACWTIVSTPIGALATYVLKPIVDKSKAENTEGGIIYEAAKATNFTKSPKI